MTLVWRKQKSPRTLWNAWTSCTTAPELSEPPVLNCFWQLKRWLSGRWAPVCLGLKATGVMENPEEWGQAWKQKTPGSSLRNGEDGRRRVVTRAERAVDKFVGSKRMFRQCLVLPATFSILVFEWETPWLSLSDQGVTKVSTVVVPRQWWWWRSWLTGSHCAFQTIWWQGRQWLMCESRCCFLFVYNFHLAGLLCEASCIFLALFLLNSDHCWQGPSGHTKAWLLVCVRFVTELRREIWGGFNELGPAWSLQRGRRLCDSSSRNTIQLSSIRRKQCEKQDGNDSLFTYAGENELCPPKHACLFVQEFACQLEQACVHWMQGKERQTSSSALFFFPFSHIVRGDCTGRDSVDCGAWLTRTPRHSISIIVQRSSFSFVSFYCGFFLSNVRWWRVDCYPTQVSGQRELARLYIFFVGNMVAMSLWMATVSGLMSANHAPLNPHPPLLFSFVSPAIFSFIFQNQPMLLYNGEIYNCIMLGWLFQMGELWLSAPWLRIPPELIVQKRKRESSK